MSSEFHLTVVPTFTVTAAGEKEKSWMVSVLPPPVLGAVELPQAALARSSAWS